MPLIMPGVYIETEDRPYEAESCYYLNFQIISALVSLEYIMMSNPKILVLFENKYQYYHYYADHLLYSIGQICNRFVITPKDRGVVLERKQANIQNFQFTPDNFPILNDKRGRNTIEHLDEHNRKIIEMCDGVGGFNLIDVDTEPSLITHLRDKRETHPYTLDLISREILIVRNGEEKLSINIDDLKNELLKLRSNVKYFSDMIKSIF